MEVKLVITPSEEMVQLVDKVINAFAGSPRTAKEEIVEKYNIPDALAETTTFAREAIEAAFEKAVVSEHKDSAAPKRRRTKAEIEAEKQAQEFDATEKAKDDTLMDDEAPAEEIVTDAPKTIFVPDVVKLRKMTVRRSELIGDVPAKLLEFGYNSVTSLAKDAAAAEKYFNYLVSVSPISVEDNA